MTCAGEPIHIVILTEIHAMARVRGDRAARAERAPPHVPGIMLRELINADLRQAP